MYARNAMFSQSNNSPSLYNSAQQGNGQNYGNTGNQGYSPELRVGSNRLQYEYGIIPDKMRGMLPQWKEEQWPASITCRPETLHLSGVEFRLEDYYLIRNKKLSPKDQNKLVQAINYSSFNRDLLQRPVQLHKYSKQPSVSDQILMRESAKPADSTNRMNSSGNGLGGNNTNNNMFGGQNNAGSNNIFSNNRTTNATNVFSSKSNTSGGNYGTNATGQGSINQSRGATGGNIFSNNNNNSNTGSTSNNVFMRNSTTSNGQTGNANTTNNMFGNNNPSTNLFNRNATNTQNSSTNNVGNNSSNSANNTAGNNIFNSNNSNNSNNTAGNNLFRNNSTNNNTASSGSNLYNNNQQQQQSNIDVNILMQTFQNFVQSSQLYLNQIKDHTTQLRQTPREEESKAEEKDFWSQVRDSQPAYNFSQELHYREEKYNWSKRREEQDCMVLILRKPKTKQLPQQQRAQQYEEEFQNIPYNHLPNQNRTIRNETILRNAPSKIQEANNKSVRMNNPLPNKSIRLSNHRDEFSSMIYSRCDFTVNQTKTRQLKLVFDEPCTCEVHLQIVWQECERKEQKIQTKNPAKRTLMMNLNRFDLQTEEGRSEFESQLKKSAFVKADARLIPDRRKTEIDHYNALVKVSGRVQQKILNIEQQKKGKSAKNVSNTSSYCVEYSKITDTHIQNLTISRQGKGTIVWQQPVPFETLDFKKDGVFFIEDYEIGCELIQLQGPCVVTFESLPPAIQALMASGKILQAKCNLQKMLQKMNKDIQFGDMWENGTWCFKLKSGFGM